MTTWARWSEVLNTARQGNLDIFEGNDAGKNLKSAMDSGVRRLRLAERLAKTTLPPIERTFVELADLDPQTDRRILRVHCDQIVYPARLLRTTLEVAQTGTGEKNPLRRGIKGEWMVEANLAKVLRESAPLGLPYLALRLDKAFPNSVLTVSRGTTGPLWFEGIEMPDWVSNLLHDHPGNLIAQTTLETMESGGPQGVENLDDLRQDGVPLALAAGWNYKRFQKFTCSEELVAPLRESLEFRRVAASMSAISL
jgi:hypothetical protein